jgi:hypothetical protein
MTLKIQKAKPNATRLIEGPFQKLDRAKQKKPNTRRMSVSIGF